MSAQITLSLEDWNNELGKRRAVEEELARVREDLNSARRLNLESIKVEAQRLDTVVRRSLDLTRFAVANLPPEVTVNWPVKALTEVIDNLSALPSFGLDDADLLVELRAVVRDIQQHEGRRQREARRPLDA